MKKLIIISMAMAMFTGVVAHAGENVRGYYRSNGTYVQPYTRSTPDNSYNNNYNVQGNINPYTGQRGTDRPTYNDRAPEYNRKSYGDSNYQTVPANPYGGSRQRSRY